MAPLLENMDEDALAVEAAELDGYFSETPLDPQPKYPALNESFASTIVITNLPKVTAAKLGKLTTVVLKVVSRIGTLVNYSTSTSTPSTDTNGNDGEETPASAEGDEAYNGLYMPMDEASGMTQGVCFVEYTSVDDAQKAVSVLQDYKFDKNHSLQVLLYERAKQLQRVKTSEFHPPTLPPFVEKPNAMAWLEDDSQRDMFITRFDRETVVYWFDAQSSEPVVDYDGSREKEAGVLWCEYYCHWSPFGSYLATLVPARGVILWSGAQYEKAGRFAAPGVKLVVFSPQENYLLTNNEDPRDSAAIKIYHIPTGKLMRAFPLYPDNVPTDAPPPPFLWSHDDAYVARQGNSLISIYETPSMRLLDKRSLATENIREFQWSPKANVLVYWAPEAPPNVPAHVDLIEIPSRKIVRQKNLFNVTNCQMVWHPQGTYLAVKVTRHTKSKKTFYNNIELFRWHDPGVPVEMLDMPHAVMALSWEPHGSRFAMIHAENPSASKVDVSFYDMMKMTEVAVANKKGGGKKTKSVLVPELNLVKQLEGKQCNMLFWSPAGNHIILASLGDTASGTLEFYDVNENSLVIKEHYRANQVLWDPSGRTVATVVSQPLEGGHFKFAMDNGYVLWSFQGKQLYQQSHETFYQLLWRPRESLLSDEQIKKVHLHWKKYEREFDKADKERQRQQYLAETQGKRAERARIRQIVARNRAIRRKHRAEYIALLGGYDSDDESHYTIRERTVETILSTREQIVM
jgi:translation initiation factor 3 subunit B